MGLRFPVRRVVEMVDRALPGLVRGRLEQPSELMEHAGRGLPCWEEGVDLAAYDDRVLGGPDGPGGALQVVDQDATGPGVEQRLEAGQGLRNLRVATRKWWTASGVPARTSISPDRRAASCDPTPA